MKSTPPPGTTLAKKPGISRVKLAMRVRPKGPRASCCHHNLRKLNEDDLNERDDYGVLFSEQQYSHGSYYISLFKCKSIDQFDQPQTFTQLWYYIVQHHYL